MVRKKAPRLFAVWILAFTFFCAIVSILASNYSYENQLVEKDLPEPIKLILSVVLLFVYCPSLLVIHNYAKQEQLLKTKRRSLFLFVTIAIAALGTIVTIIFG